MVANPATRCRSYDVVQVVPSNATVVVAIMDMVENYDNYGNHEPSFYAAEKEDRKDNIEISEEDFQV